MLEEFGHFNPAVREIIQCAFIFLARDDILITGKQTIQRRQMLAPANP